jgi:hypothetical protein
VLKIASIDSSTLVSSEGKMKLTVPLLAAALQLAGIAAGQEDAAIAANLEKFWSYGRSEPVYPSRKCDRES